MKKIEGYENYFIEESGRIWSKAQNKMKELKPMFDSWGYPRVALYSNNQRKLFRIHRLVAMSYLDNPNNYPQVNHINGIKTDNRAENLEWCDGFQNMRHAHDIGIKVNLKGSKHPLSKLREEDIPIIRQRLANGERQKDIAMDFGVTFYTISAIKRGMLWSHIK